MVVVVSIAVFGEDTFVSDVAVVDVVVIIVTGVIVFVKLIVLDVGFCVVWRAEGSNGSV